MGQRHGVFLSVRVGGERRGSSGAQRVASVSANQTVWPTLVYKDLNCVHVIFEKDWKDSAEIFIN